MKLSAPGVWTGIGLVALAFGARIAHLLAISDTALFDVTVGDGRAYAVWAREIAGGSWFSGEVFYQAPLYPYFLAVIYSLFGDGPWAPRLAQIGLGALSCLMLALAGRRFFDTRTGIAAGILLALYAPAIYYDALLQKASFGLFFSAALLFLLGEFRERPGWGRALGAGALLGCFALTRENSLILVPLAMVWAWLVPDRAGAWRWPCAVLLGVALVLVPTGLRNQAIGGRFLVTTFNLGPNFYIGNNPSANGKYRPLRKGRGGPDFERHDARILAERAIGRSLDPAEVSDYWLNRGLSYVREEPGEWLRLLARKWHMVWHSREIVDTDSIEAYRGESPLLDALARVLHFGVIAPLAVLGLWTTRRRWRRLWPLYGMTLLSAASLAAFFVLGRYRVLMIPVLLLFAAAALVELLAAVRDRRISALRGGVILAALAAIGSNWPLAVGHDPAAITLYAVGNRLREEGRKEEALGVLERAVEQAPRFSDASIALGHALMDVGRGDQAIVRFHEALRLSPASADGHNGLGAALVAQGDEEAGVAEFRRALDIEPTHSDAHNNLANALLDDGEIRDAIEHYVQALYERPRDPDILSNIGTAQALLGRFEQALASFDALLEVAPDHLPSLINRALVLEALGRKDEALRGYRRAHELATATDIEARQVAAEGMKRLANGP